jgi:tetratricopeptide (TPR) repeat protein
MKVRNREAWQLENDKPRVSASSRRVRSTAGALDTSHRRPKYSLRDGHPLSGTRFGYNARRAGMPCRRLIWSPGFLVLFRVLLLGITIGSPLILCGLQVYVSRQDAPCENQSELSGLGGALHDSSWLLQLRLPQCLTAEKQSNSAVTDDWIRLYNSAMSSARYGDNLRAVYELKRAVQERPNSFLGHLALGAVLHETGDSSGASAEFRSAFALNDGSATDLHNLGVVLLLEKKYTDAVRYLARSEGIQPGEIDNQLALAMALYESGDEEEAITSLNKAIAARPASSQLQLSLGTFYARERLYTQAIPLFQKAIELEPSNIIARLSLAKALVKIGRSTEALRWLDEVVGYDSKQPEAHYLRGNIYQERGNSVRAADDLRIAIENNPNDYDSQYAYGVVLAELGDAQQAVKHLETAHQLEPDSDGALFELARVLHRLGDEKKSRADLEIVARHKRSVYNRDIAASYVTKANQSMQDGDVKSAIAEYQKALDLDPVDAQTYYNLGLAHARAGATDPAEDAFKKAIELDQQYSAAHNQLGLLYLAQNRIQDARMQFEAALATAPECADCQDNLGVLLSSEGESKQAEVLFREAARNAPADPRPRMNLALTLAAKGDFSAALRELNGALAIAPDDINVLIALGSIQKQTDAASAIETFRKAVQLRPGSLEAHLDLGMVLLDQRQFEAALDEFSKTISIAPNAASAHYQRGLALGALHRYNEAQSELLSARRLAPQDPDIQKSLKQNERDLLSEPERR